MILVVMGPSSGLDIFWTTGTAEDLIFMQFQISKADQNMAP